MKSIKFFSFVFTLYGLLFLAYSLNGNTTKEESIFMPMDSIPGDSIPGDSIPGDTTNMENPNGGPYITPPQDLSSSFNERGYYKSNSFNANGEEIINDFNGNLCYSIPLSSGKGIGDLAYDFRINYNGNVNYQIICGNSDITSNGYGHLYIYNFSAPGWIFSLNGLAVQMINFETDYFTNTLPEAIGNNVSLLASGYHITDMLTTPTSDNKDKITIMLGDGSTETLENTQGCSYTGEYKSTSINSFMIAYVSFNTSTSPPLDEEAGTCRIMHLMKGDGLTYIYEENVMRYKDHHSQTVTAWFKPTTFLLKKIKDRFGHQYSLSYISSVGSDDCIGRHWLENCPGAQFTYPNFMNNYKGFQVGTTNGNYLFETEDMYTINAHENHRPCLNNIRNPFGERMIFSYSPYCRTGTDLKDISNNNMTIKFDNLHPLYRLSQFQNYDGGKRSYTYVNNTNSQFSYFVNTPYEVAAHSIGDDYKGQGRDLFFSNMISKVTENDGNTDIKEVLYEYYYTDNGTIAWAQPVDENDEYKTHKTVNSLNSENINSTPNTFESEKLYRNYIVKVIPTGEILDYAGTTKLVEDKYFQNGVGPEYKKMNYYYYRGTFLDSARIEKIDNAERKWHYAYSGGGYEPITWKQETDPLDLVTSTYFQFFKNPGYKVYKYGLFQLSGASYDTVKFYLINQPTYIVVSKGSNILQKKEITYFSSTDVTGQTVLSGYPGQVNQEKDIDPQNSNVALRSISYKYCNKDTTGSYLFSSYPDLWSTSGWGNNREGNLMETEDAKGNKTKYYYDLGAISQNGSPNVLTYHKLKDDGTDVIINGAWQEDRFPSRIDNYIDGDRRLSHYQLYNGIGNPTKVVNENKYLSEADYDNYYRLTRLTLPYDFNDLLDTTTIFVKKDTLSTFLTVNSNGWGYDDRMLQNDGMYLSDNGGAGTLETKGYLEEPEDSYGRRQYALVRFNTTDYDKISIIDSAFLEFAPFYASTKFNYVDTEYYDLNIFPISSITFRYSNTFTGIIDNYTLGPGIVNCNNLNLTKSHLCDGCNTIDMIQRYDSNFRRIDISNLIQSNMANNILNMVGMKFSIEYDGNSETGYVDYIMGLSHSSDCNSCYTGYNWRDNYMQQTWLINYSPKLKFYGKQIIIDTIRTVKHRSGSLIYTYDDVGNKVTLESKIDKLGGVNRNKKTVNCFDGFGFLKQTNLYNGLFTYDSVLTKYNYLYQKAKTIDAAGNSTKFSYDKYGGLAKTKNNDSSENFVSNTFESGIVTAFYSISGGFINKQVYTDETGKHFEKYYDAVGNLLREVKYVSNIPYTPDNPYDPDSTYQGNEDPGDISLITDYKYDDLYRVIEVITPGYKHIYYTYDLLGRQTSRTTPDAGETKYVYDKNNNLIYSQDENQRNRGANIYTFRNYDGLNRLLSIGEMPVDSSHICPDFDGLSPDTLYDFLGNSNQMLTVNVYDSLIYSSANVFIDVPSDYYVAGKSNNTKGALVATAYKTRTSDSWSYKYYRYDARGRVTKMWHYILGLGWKTTDYCYNSLNQVTYFDYNHGGGDAKLYRYSYDSTARLSDVSICVGNLPEDPEEDLLAQYFSYASYTYNQNSQISHYKFNGNSKDYRYRYDNRNRVYSFMKYSGTEDFTYALFYLPNGNIRQSLYTGEYRHLTDEDTILYINYVYDKSNRLTKADRKDTTAHDVSMTYDNDGNILALRRYGSNANLIDNFNNSYYINTNRLQRVTGDSAQYTYDSCGNLTGDKRDLGNIKQNMKYDHRNLLIEMQIIIPGTPDGDPPDGDPPDGDPPDGDPQVGDPPVVNNIYQVLYNYDEAGNRVRKRVYFYEGMEISPVLNDADPIGWNLITDEYYSRDISGKEIAIYHSSDLDHWNVWGTDNVGKINANGDKFFYLKDHLGTIRVVLNESNQIVSANDYDCWGYPLEGRSYQSDGGNPGSLDYKFTGKQRDTETGWDYFGARYYDARIANWGSVDPLFEKHIGWTPYNYVLRNPMMLIDPDGRQINFNKFINGGGTISDIKNIKSSLESITGCKLSLKNNQLDIVSESNTKGSAYIKKAIENKQEVVYTKGKTQANFDNGTIEYNPKEVEGFISNSKPGYASEKQGYGITFLEESIHLTDKIGHANNISFGDKDPVTEICNEIRSEAGLDKRYSYAPVDIQGESYLPYDQNSFDELARINKMIDKSSVDKRVLEEHRLSNYIKY